MLFFSSCNRRINENTRHPTFKGSFVFELVDPGKNFHKAILKKVLSFFITARVLEAQGEEPSRIQAVQFFLCLKLLLFTLFDKLF